MKKSKKLKLKFFNHISLYLNKHHTTTAVNISKNTTNLVMRNRFAYVYQIKVKKKNCICMCVIVANILCSFSFQVHVLVWNIKTIIIRITISLFSLINFKQLFVVVVRSFSLSSLYLCVNAQCNRMFTFLIAI